MTTMTNLYKKSPEFIPWKEAARNSSLNLSLNARETAQALPRVKRHTSRTLPAELSSDAEIEEPSLSCRYTT